MEYSVYDLIRILLKKWYVILITMAVIGGISVFLSQRSFAAVQESYEEYTTQTIPPETNIGTLSAAYQCSFQMNRYDRYRTVVEQERRFLWDYAQEVSGAEDLPLPEDALYSMAKEAYGYALADFQALLGNTTELIPAVQIFAEEEGYLEPPVLLSNGSTDPSQQIPLVVANHLSATVEKDGFLMLTVSGLTEEMGTALMENYLTQLQAMAKDNYHMEILAAEQSSEFTPNRSSEYTDDALLSQTVMQKPTAAPSPLKAAATGAAFGFVFACFGVLLYTFIKDSRRQAAAETRTDGHA